MAKIVNLILFDLEAYSAVIPRALMDEVKAIVSVGVDDSSR